MYLCVSTCTHTRATTLTGICTALSVRARVLLLLESSGHPGGDRDTGVSPCCVYSDEPREDGQREPTPSHQPASSRARGHHTSGWRGFLGRISGHEPRHGVLRTAATPRFHRAIQRLLHVLTGTSVTSGNNVSWTCMVPVAQTYTDPLKISEQSHRFPQDAGSAWSGGREAGWCSEHRDGKGTGNWGGWDTKDGMSSWEAAAMVVTHPVCDCSLPDTSLSPTHASEITSLRSHQHHILG